MGVPRPFLCLTALLLAAGPAEGGFRLGLDADFPAGSPREVRVEAISAAGEPIASWVFVVDGPTLDVDMPPDASGIRVSSPIHEPCLVAVPVEGAPVCTLRPLVRFDPFGAAAGRIWFRSAGGGSFKPLEPVPAHWGPGFALRDDRYDLVVAPKGRRAHILLSVAPERAGDTADAPAETATELRARFVDSAGRTLRDEPTVAVEVRTGLTGPALSRLEAWRSFYASIGVNLRSGSLRIEPLPDEPLSFVATVPGRGGIRFSGAKAAGGPVLDLGEIRFPIPGSVRAIVEVPEDVAEKLPGPVLLRPQLRRGLPGFDPPSGPAPGWVPWMAPALDLGKLLPGEWVLFARSGELALGYTTVFVAEGEEQEVVLSIGEVAVAGQVVDGAGEGVAAQVGIQPVEKTEGAKPLVTRTDEEGRFDGTLPWIGGVLMLSAFAGEASMPADVEVDPERDQTTALRLKLPGASVEVVCVDDRSGSPVPGTRLEDLVLSSDAAGTHHPRSREADGDGKVRLTGMHGGQLEFVASAPGYAKATGKVEITEDRAATHEVRLRPEGRLEGIVLGPTGRPIPGAMVTGPLVSGPGDLRLVGVSGDLRRSTTTGPDGRFVIEIPAGPVILASWAPGHRLLLATVARETGEARFVLEPRGADSVLELRGQSGELPPAGSWFVLWYGAIRVPSIVVEEAFLAGGCRFPGGSRRDGSLTLGGCLAAGKYGIGLLPLGGTEIPPGVLDVPGPPVQRIELPWVPR